MGWFEALILGIIQGLTEFLPVSSSGHLEIGKALLGVEATDDLLFTVVVHGATVLSTIVVFRKEILKLCKGLFRLELNAETVYIFKLLLSMVPILVVGVFFKDRVEALFGSGMLLVGCMLLLTALLLTLANYLGSGKREISFRDAFVIGLAQCVAVLPGLSRSGTTIATGLLLGNKKEAVAQFSFLMVLIPILGENILSLASGEISASTIPLSSLLIGFCAAFVSGWAACKFMLRIVKGKKLVYFAVYCLVVGILAIIL
ncbi:MAG: undecaprenyl-diphosphate phosphatase [Bacteroides sp.]|nr:undecaprenyl-diphosphate phosphatase [Bacteroides sp.]MCM1085303.1 undecaprenyl-diphosphate phosphatase [Bacteroides sp.]